MNKYIIIILYILIILLVCSSLTIAKEPLVAVIPFEEGDLRWKRFREDEIINGITQQVTDKLVQKENIRVIERTRIEDIIREQNFSNSGRIDPATAAEIGKILGVDSLIMGTITNMEVKETGGLSIGPLSISGLEAYIVLSGRVVDVNTAEIMNSFRGDAKVSDSSFSISDLKDISFGSKAFTDSAFGKCIDQVTTNFVDNINVESLTSRKVNENSLKGKVFKVIGEKLVINIGLNKSLNTDQIGKLVRYIEVEGLDDPVKMPVGRIQVFSVDSNASIVRVIEMYDGELPQKNDKVFFE